MSRIHNNFSVIQVFHKGCHGDTSATFLVGDVNSEGCTLVEAARRCRDEAIAICGPGIPLHYIGCTIRYVGRGSKSHSGTFHQFVMFKPNSDVIVDLTAVFLEQI